MTEAELRARLAQHGLVRPEALEAVLALAVPAVLIHTLEEEDAEDAPVGVSRLGGFPDLPPGVQPPGVFIGQLELAEVAPHAPPGVMPPDGLLSFFGNSVLYSPNPSNLSRRRNAQPCSEPWLVEFRAGVMLPFLDGLEPPEVALTPQELGAYSIVADETQDESFECQQLLGTPSLHSIWLGVPPVVVLAQRVGRRSFHYEDLAPAQRRELVERLDRRWRLLLQVNGFGDLDTGKGGFFQYWIERTRPERSDFSRVRVLEDSGL
jgi:hypothetical protein